jgi:hypothetical protein
MNTSEINKKSEGTSISPERCKQLLSLTEVQKVRLLFGKSEPEVGDVRPIERQFIRAHLNEEGQSILRMCM